MYYKFDTESLKHAKAALLLYGMYKSRAKASPLNGLETWDRFNSFVRAACLKSNNTAEFVQNFCRKAKIESVKPYWFETDEPVINRETGEYIAAEGVRDYRLNILEDNSLLPLFQNETIYLIMLVRERIQREKLEYEENTDDENND